MPEGSEEHKALLEYAEKQAKREGILIFAYEAKLKTGIEVDMLGRKPEEEPIAIECYRQIQKKTFLPRLEKLKEADLSFIICVPDMSEAEKIWGAVERAGGKIWVADLDVGLTNIKVPRSLVKKLKRLRKGNESLAQVIARLIAKTGYPSSSSTQRA